MAEVVTFAKEGSVGVITVNNPPVNALSEQMLDEYLGYLEQAAADDEVRAVIVGSQVSGRFCAGLAPFSLQFCCRVTTTLVRPGSGRNLAGMESQVLRPMITGQPSVVRLKCAKSSGKCQGMVPLKPMVPLAARA